MGPATASPASSSTGRCRLLEAKTTNGSERTPFHITRNELAVDEANHAKWHHFRLCATLQSGSG